MISSFICNCANAFSCSDWQAHDLKCSARAEVSIFALVRIDLVCADTQAQKPADTAPGTSPLKPQEVFSVRDCAHGLGLLPSESKYVSVVCSEHTQELAHCFGHSETCSCFGSIAVTILK